MLQILTYFYVLTFSINFICVLIGLKIDNYISKKNYMTDKKYENETFRKMLTAILKMHCFTIIITNYIGT